MSIKREPFTPTRDQEERDNDKSFHRTLRLNVEELEQLEYIKKIMSQPKDGTAIKEALSIAYFVLQRPEMEFILNKVFKNKANNWRTGATDPGML